MSRVREMWSDSVGILVVEPLGFPDELSTQCENKREAENGWEAVASNCYPCRWKPLSI